jgi:intein/homing endonuclease
MTASATEVMSNLTFLDKYSRFQWDKGRRETWEETVKRVVDYLSDLGKLNEEEYRVIFEAIKNKRVAPAMRLMSTAGEAARQNPASIFNCSYLPLESSSDIHDLTLLLGLGVGVGFSVEKHFVDNFGYVSHSTGKTYTYVINDDIYSWAQSFKFLVDHAIEGNSVAFDYSLIRPAGAPLKTRGGRASGPAPLLEAHSKVQELLASRRGMRLTTIDVFDIACYIAGAIVSGGVRRCLPSGSRVHTKNGMKKIEEVDIGDLVLTSNGYYPVLEKFYQGKQSLVRVVTQDSSFLCTPNHKIAVLDGKNGYNWKEAGSLEFGDKLISPSVSIDGVKQHMPPLNLNSKSSFFSKSITIPELDEEMAWFLGLFQGDGYVNQHGVVSVSVNGNELETGVRVANQLRRFGVYVGLSEYDNYFVLRVSSKQLANYLYSWLKQPKTPLCVPEVIWNSTKEIRMAFVSGLMDADGSIKNKPVNVVTTIYEDYAKEIQVLLSSCGVQSRVKALSQCGLKSNWNKKFGVYLINNKSKEDFSCIPTLFKNKITFSNNERHTNQYNDGQNWSETNEVLIPVSFVRIEALDKQEETWDIEVEEQHEFFCNGYLVHNSAMISIFDKDDELMLSAKTGEWWRDNLQRQYANISVIIDEYLSQDEMSSIIDRMHNSGFGEPGIFSRYALRATMPKRRKIVANMGVNPCAEIILRPRQFCNLSQVILNESDTKEDIREKIKIATIIGTIQSSVNSFRGLHEDYEKNNTQERLLGVSLSGMSDNQLVADEAFLSELKELVIETNKIWAKRLGIKQSAATTCIKPDGNTSVLYNTSPGLHPRYSKYYIRRVRLQYQNPVSQWLMSQGVPCEPVLGETWENVRTVVFSFPIKSPDSVTRFQEEVGAIEQLNTWLSIKKNYTEHNPSVTTHYKPNELEDIKKFAFENQEFLSGVSFLENGHKYQQAPYEQITKDEYELMLSEFPKVDFNKFWEFETLFDSTSGAQTLACVGGACIV